MFRSLGFAVTKVQLTLILVPFLLVNFSSYCQSVTRTASTKDSLVLLPKNLVVYMLQDLTQADSDRVELKLLEQNVNLQNELILKQRDVIIRLSSQCDIYKETYEMCSTNRDSIEQELITLDKSHTKAVKQKRFFATTSGILTSLLLIILL